MTDNDSNVPSTDLQTFQQMQSPASTPTLPGTLVSGTGRLGLVKQNSMSFDPNMSVQSFSNVKDIHGDKALALISQRLQKQSHD